MSLPINRLSWPFEVNKIKILTLGFPSIVWNTLVSSMEWHLFDLWVQTNPSKKYLYVFVLDFLYCPGSFLALWHLTSPNAYFVFFNCHCDFHKIFLGLFIFFIILYVCITKIMLYVLFTVSGRQGSMMKRAPAPPPPPTSKPQPPPAPPSMWTSQPIRGWKCLCCHSSLYY